MSNFSLSMQLLKISGFEFQEKILIFEIFQNFSHFHPLLVRKKLTRMISFQCHNFPRDLLIENDFLVFLKTFSLFFLLAALEIFFPIVIVLMLLKVYEMGTDRMPSTRISKAQKFDEFDLKPIRRNGDCYFYRNGVKTLAYTPVNDVTKSIIEKTANDLNFKNKKFKTEADMDRWIHKLPKDTAAVGIVFDNSFVSGISFNLSWIFVKKIF